MDQISPVLSEVHIETASWNICSQPPTPDVEIVADRDSSNEFYSVTVGGSLEIKQAANSHTLTPDVLPGEEDVIVDDLGEQDAVKTPRKSPGARKVLPALTISSKIAVTLEGALLWQEFCKAGTEMIITKSGRRMFPGIGLSLAGLEPDCKYTISMEVNPADNHRYKYLNSKWVVVGKSDAHCDEMLKYVHPDSPASGRHWMANKVAFKKIKITNNKSNRHGHVTLNSMHKYIPRIIISKHLSKKKSALVHTEDLTDCCFIAVTAYQNDQVTQLKIDYNPFAKAFRDNTAEQEMMAHQGVMGVWHPSSPLLHPYPYSPDAQGPMPMSLPGMPSPVLNLSGASPLPQFAAAFGNWETPPYSPRTSMIAASPGILPSPVTTPLSDPRQFLWNTSRLQQESPPISPLLYTPGLYSPQGSSVYQFPLEAATKSPSALATVNYSSLQWQRAAPSGVPYQVSQSPVGYGPSQPLQPCAFRPPPPDYPGVPSLAMLPVPKMEPHLGSPQEPITN